MNGNTGGSGSRGRSLLRRLGVPAAAAAVALLAAACGGGGDPSGGSHETTYQKELAFSECMRAHGVPNFPDPGSNGVITSQGGGKASAKPQTQRIGGPQMTKANKDCAHLLPNGGVPTAAQRQEMLNQALKFTECMRSHGVPNMPDPSTGGGAVSLGGSGINLNSPQFQSAQHACQRYLLGKRGGLQVP